MLPVENGLVKKIQSMGVITIELKYIRNLRAAKKIGILKKTISSIAVSQKAMKGQIKSHRTGCVGQSSLSPRTDLLIAFRVSESVPASPVSFCDCDIGKEDPFATFSFKYRSIGIFWTSASVFDHHLSQICSRSSVSKYLSP